MSSKSIFRVISTLILFFLSVEVLIFDFPPFFFRVLGIVTGVVAEVEGQSFIIMFFLCFEVALMLDFGGDSIFSVGVGS